MLSPITDVDEFKADIYSLLQNLIPGHFQAAVSM